MLVSVAYETLTNISFYFLYRVKRLRSPPLSVSELYDLKRSMTIIHRSENKALFHIYDMIFVVVFQREVVIFSLSVPF